MALSNPLLLSSCSVHRLNPLLFSRRRYGIRLSQRHFNSFNHRFFAGKKSFLFALLLPEKVQFSRVSAVVVGIT